MAFLLKYENGGELFFHVSEAPNSREKVILTSNDFRGKVTSKDVKNIQSIIAQLKALPVDTTPVDTTPVEPAKEPEKEPAKNPDKEKKTEEVVKALDKVASDLQADGREDLALIVDRISDRLEGR